MFFAARRNPHDEPKHLTMRVLLFTLCRFASIERDLAPCHNINSRTQAGRIAVATQQFSVKVVDLECLTRLSVRLNGFQRRRLTRRTVGSVTDTIW